jgi:hypothetical protein
MKPDGYEFRPTEKAGNRKLDHPRAIVSAGECWHDRHRAYPSRRSIRRTTRAAALLSEDGEARLESNRQREDLRRPAGRDSAFYSDVYPRNERDRSTPL